MAAKPKLHREPNIDLLADRIADLRSVLQQENPVHLAQRTGAQYHQTSEGKGEFRLSWWEQELILSFPEFEVKQASSGESLLTYQQAMLLYYFTTSDGTPPAGKWISFSELPDGRFYHTAFQGYTGKAVAQAYGNDLVAFRRAAERQGGLSRHLYYHSRPCGRNGTQHFYWRRQPDNPQPGGWRGDSRYPERKDSE